MSISAFTGPVVSFGQGTSDDYNPQMGPSLFYAGTGTLDPRAQFTYQPGQRTGQPTYGFLGTTRIQTLNAIPITLTAALLAATQNTVAATPMTLVSSAATGVAVGVSITRQDTGVLVTGLLEIDPPIAVATATIAAGTTVMNVTALTAPSGDGYNTFFPGMIISGTSVVTGTTITSFGTGNGGIGTYNISTAPSAGISGGTITGKSSGLINGIGFGSDTCINLWNPVVLLGRAVSITSTTNQVVSTFTIRGFDVYGFPITEVITLSGTTATTTNGKKAFKYILSVTPNTTDAVNTYSVDTTDILGFPLRSDTWQAAAESDTSIMSNNALIAASTGYVAAVKTVATATTGDVRGTFALQTASNGTLRVIFTQSPPIPAFASVAGLFGVTQFSDF